MRKLLTYFVFCLVFLLILDTLPQAEDSQVQQTMISDSAYAQSRDARRGSSSSNSRSSSSSSVSPTPTPPDPSPTAEPTPPQCCPSGGITCSEGACQSPPSAGSSVSCSSSSRSSSSSSSSKRTVSTAQRTSEALRKRGKRGTKALMNLSERRSTMLRYAGLKSKIPAGAGLSVRKKQKSCENGCPLPDGCTLIHGTPEDAEWMQCFRNAGAPLHEVCCNACDAVADCKLSEDDEKDIVEQCKDLPEAEKMDCAYEHIKDRLGEGPVCRHHADCVEDIFDQLGLDTDYEVGCTGLFTCHAWIETIDSNGCTTITDTFNSIAFRCCPEK